MYRKVQVEGLSKNYQEDPKFALKIKTLPSLAFVPEMEVVDCFNLLMQDFPEVHLIWPNISRIITSAKSYQMEQREQSLQEANIAKWEAGEIKHKSKVIKMRDQSPQI